MKIKYLSYLQARAIRSEFEYLKGQVFDKNCLSNGYIRDVLVAPYSRIIQWDFLRRLSKGASPDIINELTCQGKYEVVVISDKLDDDTRQFLIKNLRDYLEENDIAFDPRRYSILRNYS